MYSSFDTFDTFLWEIMWKHVVSMSGVQYSLTDKVVGCEFVQLLTGELGLLAEGKSLSERFMCLTPMLLGRDYMVRKSSDIRRLVAKCMELWKSEHYDALVSELGHLTSWSKQMLTLYGYSHDSCFVVKSKRITGRTAGHLLEPTDIDSKSGFRCPQREAPTTWQAQPKSSFAQ